MNIKKLFFLLLGITILIGCEEKQTSKGGKIERATFGGSDEIKQGLHIYNFDNSKKKRAEINYTDGKKDGIAKEYYKNGRLKQTINYVMGKKQGVSKMYQQDGKTLYKEAYYEDGIVVQRKYFYKDGTLKSDASYIDGKPTIHLKEYYKSGKLKTKYPKIQVKENDDTALYDQVVLEVTLSEKRKNVRFYVAKDEKAKIETIDLKKYDLTPVAMVDKRGVIEFKVPKEHHIMAKLPIYAEYTTISGRKKIDKLIYNLYVTNY